MTRRLLGLVLVGALLVPPVANAEAVTAHRQMVVAAHPLAAAAGLEALRDGGNVVDAAVAVQMVLTLVEPQSSGIGGGAFLVHRDPGSGALAVYDGRETAPAGAAADMFLDAAGRPLAFADAVPGGRSVGVPGVLRMLELAHRRHGRLPWARLFRPAIALAEAGFPVSARLAAMIAETDDLDAFAATAAYFLPDGVPLPAGAPLRNPALAAALRVLADEGADPLYAGPLAAAIAAAVNTSPRNPGRMTEADLAGYAARIREPLCGTYRGWRICGPPPPSSGPFTVLQVLGLLEGYPSAALVPWTVPAAHLFAEASRLAFADRNRWIADPEFVRAPVEALLARPYLARRAGLIRPDAAGGKAMPGDPLADRTAAPSDETERPPSTSHVSIVDAEGGIVSMTTTIESAFGSRLMVRGFLLNNELTDFAFRPGSAEAPVANRVEPGKRPRSSMAPVIAFAPDGRPALVAGSPGGPRIIAYVAKTLIGIVDGGLSIDAAVAAPNLSNRNGPTYLEAGTSAASLAPALAALGHEIRVAPLTSGVNAIRIFADGRLVGAADPRREGVAVGD